MNDIVTELTDRNKALEKNNQDLQEANMALKVLIKKLDQAKRDADKQILNDIHKNIFPLTVEMKRVNTNTPLGRVIEQLLIHIDGLCSHLEDKNRKNLGRLLSQTEMNVALLVREGMHSKDIAKHLNISVNTVKTHRKNIRKKLDIQNSNINLSSYVRMQWHDRY